MAQPSARGAALAALRAWRTRRDHADAIIAKLLKERTLGPSDRGFALELFYGVLRNQTLLDFWIGCLRSSQIEAQLRDIVRLGLYQLLLAGVAEHAAVYESVELTPPKSRGFVNGMLRAATRQQETLRQRAHSQPLSVRTSHPEFLIQRWEKHFGPEATAALCAWNNRAPHVYARMNKLKISDEEFVEQYPDAQRLADDSRFFEFSVFPSEALERGHCYIQDPSTAMACDLLDPQPGDNILDTCAAPGGKTGYIAERMQNAGCIIACDRQSERIRILSENMTNLGVEIARITRHDWRIDGTTSQFAPVAPFDRILIDAPCTNTGVLRRRVDARWRLRPIDFVRMQKEQLEIARAVLPLLKHGGRLVYSTCSLEPEENEQVVEQLLTNHPNLRLVETKHCLPFRDHFDGAFAAKFMVDQSA